MSEVVRVTCPGCGGALKIPAVLAGRTVKCKQCGASVRTGVAPPPASAGPPPGYNPPPGVPGHVPAPVVVAPPAVVAAPVYTESPADYFALPPEPIGVTSRHRPRGGGGQLGWVVVALLTASAVVTGGLYGKPLFEKLRGLDAPAPAGTAAAPVAAAGGGLSRAGQPFPRRLLVLSVTKYLYCNPLTGGNAANADLVSLAARRLAFQWRVPTAGANNQLFVVTDVGDKPRPMLRDTVKEAAARFAATSRPQDRVCVYFGGHATLIDGKAYLVPTDGDLADPASLVPLADFVKVIADCPAQEKIVVYDVCRVTPDGDRQRPGSEPLSAELEKVLLSPPAGVRVVLTAAAGANALEFRSPPPGAPEVGGSLFLSALTRLAEAGAVKLPAEPTPADPLPLAEWVAAARDRMGKVAAAAGQPPPAVQVAGTAPTAAVPPDPAAEPAARFDLPPPPAGLPVAEVAKVAARVNGLPPYRGQPGPDDAVDALVPFPADVMAGYTPDGVPDADILKAPAEYPVRAAALKGLAVIKKEWRSTGDGQTGLRQELSGSTGDALKKQILAEQEAPARIEDELDTALMQCDKAAAKLDSEKSKYWRVTFQYTVAQLKARLAFMREYNLALGNIRTDSLPAVDRDKDQVGLVLVSTEKMKSKKDVKDLADEAADLFAKVADEHKGTPWAVLARRHKAMALGLEWKPQVSTAAAKLE